MQSKNDKWNSIVCLMVVIYYISKFIVYCLLTLLLHLGSLCIFIEICISSTPNLSPPVFSNNVLNSSAQITLLESSGGTGDYSRDGCTFHIVHSVRVMCPGICPQFNQSFLQQHVDFWTTLFLL